MLRQARRKAAQHGFQLRACRARAQSLPFTDAYFDSVVSTFPSDYILENETIRELYRVLRSPGRLVIVPAGWLRPTGPSGKLFSSVSRLVYGAEDLNSSSARWPDAQLRDRIRSSLWLSTLGARLVAAGFAVKWYLAANSRGAALVIEAVKGTDDAH
jgi:SAM-dependent methyltransferase